LNLSRFGEAAEHFERSVGLNPDSAAAYYNLALSYQGLGRLTDALDAYDATLRIDPRFADASTRRADLLPWALAQGVVRLFVS
jgi:tetratricopeptide (TPR) repeat protein